MKIKVKDITLIAVFAAVLVASQLAVSFLPNIELVSLLTIIFTMTLGWRAVFIIAIFVLAEGAIFGFSDWWLSYIYVWYVLFFIAYSFRKITSPVFWAAISGSFGLVFGTLCAVVQLFIGGPAFAFSYIISGLTFDFIHCVSNFFIALVLFLPIYKVVSKLAGDCT